MDRKDRGEEVATNARQKPVRPDVIDGRRGRTSVDGRNEAGVRRAMAGGFASPRGFRNA